MTTLTPEQKAKLKRLLTDPFLYFPKLLKIRDKAGRIISFTPNQAQERLMRVVEECKKQGKPIRIIILKARQFGLSTATEGLIFQDTSSQRNRNSLIVAHVRKTATNIFNMSKRFLDHLPDQLRPMLSHSNSNDLIFDNPSKNPRERERKPGLGSQISIQSAESLSTGRGDTIHNLHASEVAFWADGETLMAGLMQAVPNLPNTMIVIESTANGVGDYFYNMWKQAEQGENDFIPLFFPWYEHHEYQMEVPHDFVRTEEEEELQRTYGITDRQLAWRRWCIRNNCNNDVDTFKQEYPTYPDEAFLTTGRPRFDLKAVQSYLVNAKPGERGDVVLLLQPSTNQATFGALFGNRYSRDDSKFIPDDKGLVEVWKRPEPGKRYVIGADTAEGLEHGDWCSATVWDADTLEQVARYRSHVDPDLYANHLAALGHYYGRSQYELALIVPEENNHGHSLIQALKRLNYPNIYRRETFDERTDKVTKKLGFRTDKKTKPLVIDKLAELLRERSISTKDKIFLSECMTYIRDEKGGTNAQQGCHDDTVMASAIALWVCVSFVSDYFDTRDPLKAVIIQDHLPHALRDDPVYPSIYDL